MFEAFIIKYLGKVEKGVLVLLNIKFNNENYDATFYYTDIDILLTVSDELENKLNHNIKEDENYIFLLKDILSKLKPYNEIYEKL